MIFNIFKKKKRSNKSICSICEEVFEDSLITEKDTLTFCQKHLNLYLNQEWILEKEVECTPENEEASVALYKYKNNQYAKGFPGYLTTEYKESEGELVTILKYFRVKF